MLEYSYTDTINGYMCRSCGIFYKVLVLVRIRCCRIGADACNLLKHKSLPQITRLVRRPTAESYKSLHRLLYNTSYILE